MQRIQLSRRRGWKMPEGTRKVDRTTLWGNPFPVAEYGVDRSLELYRQHVERMTPGALSMWLAPLRSAVALACWCKVGESCHADILIEYLEKDRARFDRATDLQMAPLDHWADGFCPCGRAVEMPTAFSLPKFCNCGRYYAFLYDDQGKPYIGVDRSRMHEDATL